MNRLATIAGAPATTSPPRPSSGYAFVASRNDNVNARRVFPAPSNPPNTTLRETATVSDRLSPFRRHVAFLRWTTLLLQGILLLAD